MGPITEDAPTIYTERGAVEPLKLGLTVHVGGHGNSMTPLLESGEVVIVKPIDALDRLKKGDIVLCKVKGRVYLHKITGVRGRKICGNKIYQISNNHGYVNGWTSTIYGKVIAKAPVAQRQSNRF